MGDIRKDIERIKASLCCLSASSNTTSDPCCPETNSVLSNILLELQKQKYDFELLCASTDSRIIVSKFNKETGIQELTELDGSAIVDGATGVNCKDASYDREIISICVNGEQWTKILIFNSLFPSTIEAIIFLDSFDNIQPAPVTYSHGMCPVVYDKIVNGEVTFLPQGGAIATTFNGNPVSDVMVTNLTPNIIEIKYSTLFPVSGNSLFYCASGQTVHINTNDVNDLIQEITITDVLSIGDGNIIINATRI
jgi:hypothetical protein